MILSLAVQAQSTQNYLANNTVLIVRHTEKPETGTGLTLQGKSPLVFTRNTFNRFKRTASLSR
jgi:hypothetical protein